MRRLPQNPQGVGAKDPGAVAPVQQGQEKHASPHKHRMAKAFKGVAKCDTLQRIGSASATDQAGQNPEQLTHWKNNTGRRGHRIGNS